MSTRPDEIDLEVALEFLERGRAQFVDARPSREFQRSRRIIPSAIHLDPDRRADLDARLRDIPRERLIIAYCDEPGHAASAQIARRARELGRGDASILVGGFQAWLEAELPTTTPEDAPLPVWTPLEASAETEPEIEIEIEVELEDEETLTLDSSMLAPDQPIPLAHAAEGANQSPPLSWEGVPRLARSLVLLFEDLGPGPAVPLRPDTNWILYNLQPASSRLDQDADRAGLPAGAQRGRNDSGRSGYQGPDPDLGRHRYRFRLQALDTVLDSSRLGEPTRAELERATRGHVIAEAELTCFYQRQLGTADEVPIAP